MAGPVDWEKVIEDYKRRVILPKQMRAQIAMERIRVDRANAERKANGYVYESDDDWRFWD